MEFELKATAAQERVEELTLELNSVREAYEQSQKELQGLRETQEEIIEQRCQDLQIQIEEVMLELESSKGDLAASGAF
jgi:archaellum component FlaC